jgi:outer membrane protein TolC
MTIKSMNSKTMTTKISRGVKMGKGFSKASKLLASASMLVLLSACAVTPTPFTSEEMKAQIQADKGQMFAADDPVTKPLSLPDAIARALKHNLDHRTKVMEQALALGQTKVDRWDMLPKLVSNAGYSYRSEPNATVSKTVSTGERGTSPSYSADPHSFTADLTMSWNVLDFGVSYFNAHQNADRSLIAEERRRKTVHNLVQEVRFAYWRATAAQVLEADVQNAITLAETALDDARKVEQANLKNPADVLRFQKTLLETLRQLESISQELSTARVELAALVNLPPGSVMILEVPANSQMALPAFSMPIEQMEETALLNNADLREQGYNARIAVDETKKTVLKLLPGISFSVGRNYDHNSFLMDNHWFEAGAKVTWNIFNLLSAPDQIANAKANETVASARRVALRMAVLAQVHVGYRNFLNASKQYGRADDMYKVEKRLADFATVRADNDAQSVMERISNQAGAIAAGLRRYQSYAQVQSSLGRLYATLGQDFLPGTVVSHDMETLSKAVALSLDAWSTGQSSAPQAIAPITAEVKAVDVPGAVEAAPTSSQMDAPVTQDPTDVLSDWFQGLFSVAPATEIDAAKMHDHVNALVAVSGR